jgi:hypothetical protein
MEIEFDSKAHLFVTELIAQLALIGDCEVYGLRKMHKGRGELRIAHHGPDLQHANGRGVFARIQPTESGATLIRPLRLTGGQRKTALNENNTEDVLRDIHSWRLQTLIIKKADEKSDPNKPGAVQGGQFESKRSKH